MSEPDNQGVSQASSAGDSNDVESLRRELEAVREELRQERARDDQPPTQPAVLQDALGPTLETSPTIWDLVMKPAWFFDGLTRVRQGTFVACLIVIGLAPSVLQEALRSHPEPDPWGVAGHVIGSMIGAVPIAYFLIGSLFGLGLSLCCYDNFTFGAARRIYLYSSQPLAWSLLAGTFLIGNGWLPELGLLLMICGAGWSVWISYIGARRCFICGKALPFLVTVVIPTLMYWAGILWAALRLWRSAS